MIVTPVYMDRREAQTGMTLVEILVVLALLGLLSAFLVPSLLKGARQDTNNLAASAFIKTIGASLEVYRNDRRIGVFPPSSLEDFPAAGRMRNRTNMGIEALVVCLNSEKLRDDVLDQFNDNLENLDGDSSKKRLSRYANRDLFEVTDPWDNPYAYFNAADYGNPNVRSYLVLEEDGDDHLPVTAKPWKNPKTGSYYNQNTYQLFSAGPDGKFNTEDDVGNW